MSFKSIAITGTKGKTTVSYLVDNILLALKKNTIRVDTTGHFVNGERKSTLEESKEIWQLVPTVCPGRFLWELKNFTKEERDNTVAVLESSLGCSNPAGMGYRSHDIGVWTNVMKDHLGSTLRLNSRADIADAKEFVFNRIGDDGYAVFNACDDLVCSKLGEIWNKSTLIPVILDENKIEMDIDKHLADGGVAFVLQGTKILLRNKNEDSLVYDAKDLPWAFEGHYAPSMINLTFAIATIYAVYEGNFPAGLSEIVDKLRLDPYGGRVTVLNAKNGATIIADYAHETESLTSVGHLARLIADKKSGKTIGVVRLAYDRTNELIDETGQAIGKAFDEVVVYDKIDGYWRKPQKLSGFSRFVQEVGRISGLLSAAVKKTNPNVDTILREDEALEFAAKKAGENDVVVVIVNDNVKRSVDWIREKFEADFA